MKKRIRLKTVVKKVQHQRVFTVDELAKYNGKNGYKVIYFSWRNSI